MRFELTRTRYIEWNINTEIYYNSWAIKANKEGHSWGNMTSCKYRRHIIWMVDIQMIKFVGISMQEPIFITWEVQNQPNNTTWCLEWRQNHVNSPDTGIIAMKKLLQAHPMHLLPIPVSCWWSPEQWCCKQQSAHCAYVLPIVFHFSRREYCRTLILWVPLRLVATCCPSVLACHCRRYYISFALVRLFRGCYRLHARKFMLCH